ncbi:MAG: hypothetical protein RMY35_006760 [Nostoc sp. DedSLP01]
MAIWHYKFLFWSLNEITQQDTPVVDQSCRITKAANSQRSVTASLQLASNLPENT